MQLSTSNGVLKWMHHGNIFKDTQGMVEAGAKPKQGNV
jgi:hypothetical protein